jgi:hypothetical protein
MENWEMLDLIYFMCKEYGNDYDDFEIPYCEMLRNNYEEELFLLDNGKLYTLFYDNDDWAESCFVELSKQNVDIRTKYLPNGVNIHFTAMILNKTNMMTLMTHPEEIEVFNVSKYYTTDYKDLNARLEYFIHYQLNEENNIPIAIFVSDVHDIRHLNLLNNIAKDFNIPIIAGMKMSNKLAEMIDECVEYETPVTEVLDVGLWCNNKVFKKMENAINVSEIVFIQVGDKCIRVNY